MRSDRAILPSPFRATEQQKAERRMSVPKEKKKKETNKIDKQIVSLRPLQARHGKTSPTTT
jgi:hypothetical protein